MHLVPLTLFSLVGFFAAVSISLSLIILWGVRALHAKDVRVKEPRPRTSTWKIYCRRCARWEGSSPGEEAWRGGTWGCRDPAPHQPTAQDSPRAWRNPQRAALPRSRETWWEPFHASCLFPPSQAGRISCSRSLTSHLSPSQYTQLSPLEWSGASQSPSTGYPMPIDAFLPISCPRTFLPWV